jgi:tetratricopeptide (TPR) repeat protein
MMVGGNAEARERAASDWIDAWRSEHPEGTVLVEPSASEWPFRFPLAPPLPRGPALVQAADVHEAFINHQTSSTRLVTTEALFLCETWAEALRSHGKATLVATANSASLAEHAPEVLAGRGLFAGAVRRIRGEEPDLQSSSLLDGGSLTALARAFRASDPAARLRLCLEALDGERSAAALVATASVCMEVNDFEAATRDLDEALSIAPDWAAAHFERGKLWLRTDDMTRASESFRAATRALPGFGPAWANLGGTLGELDRTTEALEAFERALACDPASPQALNNIGVARRELGRLSESEAAFRHVIQLTPDLAFGYYNLGHTLFLQGRYQAALSAYAEGRGRDAEKNPVQATRLALCKIATGDAEGALRDLQQATTALPKEYRRQLLADTSAVLWALVTQKPDLSGWQPVHAWMSRELERLV